MSKYNSILNKRISERKEEEQKQEDLRSKYNIENKEVIVVEKESSIKDVYRAIRNIISFILRAIWAVFATIGLMAVVYAGPRAELIKIFTDVISLLSGRAA